MGVEVRIAAGFSLLALTACATTEVGAGNVMGAAGQAANASGWTGKDVALLVGPILTAIVAALAVWASRRNTKESVDSSRENARAERWREANQVEAERIDELISTFHIPFIVMSAANNLMAQDLRDRLGDPKYRMLVALFDSEWLPSLSAGDQALVAEVCRLAMRLRKFIEQKAGGVDAALTPYLARASTHFRILTLAHSGRLGSDPAPFERYVYPVALDGAVMSDLKRLQERLEVLRSKPDIEHGPIAKLMLPPELALAPWPTPPRAVPGSS